MKCRFNTTYREMYESQEKYIPFDCNFQALKNGLCMFHDKSFYKNAENHDKIQKTIDSIFDQSAENEDIACIGYNLPAISIRKIFKNRIFFDKTKFFGPVEIESIFMKEVSFKDCQFLDYANFYLSNFHTFIDFSNTIFSKRVNFASVQLNQPWFKETEFHNHSNFQNAIFARHVTFQQCKMKNPYFFEANFKEGVTISACNIEEGVFANTIFGGEVNIYGSTFHSLKGLAVTFGNAKFSGRTKFINCSFNTIAYFDHITFEDYLELNECHFLLPANFNETKFSSVSFHQTEYVRATYFVQSTFNSEADFSQVRFKDFADFSECEFKANANFLEAEFKRVNFVNNKFQKTSFLRTKFHETIFKNVLFSDETKFHFTFFEDQQHTIFNGVNLQNVSFLNTDILRIKFDNVDWSKDNPYKIFEERILEQKSKTNEKYEFDFDLDDVLSIYRNLRENYEYRLKYDEAGEFFIREMEVRRNYKENKD